MKFHFMFLIIDNKAWSDVHNIFVNCVDGDCEEYSPGGIECPDNGHCPQQIRVDIELRVAVGER